MTLGRFTPWAVWLVVLAEPSAVQAQTTLRYQFKAGEKFDYALEQIVKNTSESMGKSYETRQTTQAQMTWEVQEVDAQGNAKIRIRHSRFKVILQLPGGNAEYDSAKLPDVKDDNDKLYVPLVRTLGKAELTVTLSPLGYLRDLTLADDFLKEAKTVPAEVVGKDDQSSLKGMLFQGTLLLPNRPVAKGESWQQTSTSRGPLGDMKAEQNYTYQGTVPRDGVTLEKIGLHSILKVVTPKEAKDATMTLDESKGEGTALFDNRAGRLLELQSTQTTKMDMKTGERVVRYTVEQFTKLEWRPTPKQ